MPPRRRSSRSVPPPQLNEAAQLADQLQQAGLHQTRHRPHHQPRPLPGLPVLHKKQRRRLRPRPAAGPDRHPSRMGITDLPELTTLAARHITRRTTTSGTRARVRTKALLITPTGTGTGRVAAQAIASGSARLRPLIAEAARQNLRLAFTVRLAKTGYLHPSGSRTDSPGIRRDVIQRTDHTEERSYGSAQTGGHDATDFARRVDAAAWRRHRRRPSMARGDRTHPPGRPHHPSRNPHLAPPLINR